MMRNIERFPSKQMYPYLSLVERKVAELYHNIYISSSTIKHKWQEHGVREKKCFTVDLF